MHACHLDARERRAGRARRACSPSSRRGSRPRSTATRSSGCAARSSATAARPGRSRSSCRPARPTWRRSIAAFEDEHERLYGVRGEPGSPIVIRALRLAALGPSSAVDRLSLDDQPPDRPGTRAASFGGEPVEAPVRTRASIGEAPEPGPMLVDEYDTTVVVRPGWTVRRDRATETLILEGPVPDASRASGSGASPASPVAPSPRRPCPERTCPFRPLGLPTSRPDAIEPTAEIVTCLQQKCANFVTIRPQAAAPAAPAPRRTREDGEPWLAPPSTRSRSRSSATRSRRSRTRWRRRSSAPRTRPSCATAWTSRPRSATRTARRSRRR